MLRVASVRNGEALEVENAEARREQNAEKNIILKAIIAVFTDVK